MCVRLGAEGVFGYQPAMLQHFLCGVFMRGRVDHVHAAAHNANRRQFMPEGLFVRMNINSVSKPADD